MDDVDKNLDLFYREVPVLKLLGTPRHIDSDIPYDVDKDVQLVCKYLQAYRSNSIDRLYRDGCPLIKFSLYRDIPDEQCHSLLKTYMPDHIACSKITQHLFIRCVIYD